MNATNVCRSYLSCSEQALYVYKQFPALYNKPSDERPPALSKLWWWSAGSHTFLLYKATHRSDCMNTDIEHHPYRNPISNHWTSKVTDVNVKQIWSKILHADGPKTDCWDQATLQTAVFSFLLTWSPMWSCTFWETIQHGSKWDRVGTSYLILGWSSADDIYPLICQLLQ